MMLTAHCYVCDTFALLSPRSRCVACEYKRAVANEEENETLREQVHALKIQIHFMATTEDITLSRASDLEDFIRRDNQAAMESHGTS